LYVKLKETRFCISLLCIDTAGYVKVWHYPTQQCVFTFDEKERQPLALDFNSTYTLLFVAGIINHMKI